MNYNQSQQSWMLIDSSLNDLSRDDLAAQTRPNPPIEEETRNDLECFGKAGEISVWIVYAPRIVIDIQDILGIVSVMQTLPGLPMASPILVPRFGGNYGNPLP